MLGVRGKTLLVSTLLALAFAGCGDDGGAASAEGDGATPTPIAEGDGSGSTPDNGGTPDPAGTTPAGGSETAPEETQPMANQGCVTDADCAPGETCQSFGMGASACIADCTDDSMCPDGQVCTIMAGATEGMCLPDFGQCSDDSECAPGEMCLDAAGVGIGGCAVPTDTMLEAGVAGSACTGDDECGTGSCIDSVMGLGQSIPLSTSICSGPCMADSECGEGGVCAGVIPIANPTGNCTNACATDAECAAGLTCQAPLIPGGSGGMSCMPDAGGVLGGGGMGGIPGGMGGIPGGP